ncbi:patatin-like phospholipase family protein [Allobacillus sp. GCM10007491]|uniref:Patatin-like phospholipase family protein n=2 Tax=Allobacillus TaxID=1400133 RepID=A0A941CV46_9BACI|nr:MULTISPECIES: patatin-like phospholipase family protein [Allobacillus]MBR7552780.1 patatin-like phospholipase family protein [Allobacillus saliphilus]TSJ67049.1 patatin family protein [Allobacillus salarius]
MARPKIGLALGSGGARGFSHLGVIKKLEEANIPIDYIAGSSMGALVGTFYGAGQKIEDLYMLASTFKLKYFMDFTVPKLGLIQGDRIKTYIQMFTYQKQLEELPIPVHVVATDIYSGEKVVLKEGSVAKAVRASISIPGIFAPEEIDGRMLVDGGVIDRVPISVVRDMGADLVIAVDCSKFESNSDVNTIYDVIMQSIDIMQDDITQQAIMNAEVVMRPHVYQYSSRNYTQIEEIIREGEIEAVKYLDPIKKMIADWKDQ